MVDTTDHSTLTAPPRESDKERTKATVRLAAGALTGIAGVALAWSLTGSWVKGLPLGAVLAAGVIAIWRTIQRRFGTLADHVPWGGVAGLIAAVNLLAAALAVGTVGTFGYKQAESRVHQPTVTITSVSKVDDPNNEFDFTVGIETSHLHGKQLWPVLSGSTPMTFYPFRADPPGWSHYQVLIYTGLDDKSSKVLYVYALSATESGPLRQRVRDTELLRDLQVKPNPLTENGMTMENSPLEHHDALAVVCLIERAEPCPAGSVRWKGDGGGQAFTRRR